MTEQLEKLPVDERRALANFQVRYGARVRWAEAKELLGVGRDQIFKKVVDAHPEMRHRLAGEERYHYLTAIIFLMLPSVSRRAFCGEGLKR